MSGGKSTNGSVLSHLQRSWKSNPFEQRASRLTIESMQGLGSVMYVGGINEP